MSSPASPRDPDAPVEVRPVASKADRARFLGLPYDLHRGQPGWVPPLRMAEAQVQDPDRNPFFLHAEAAHFLAWRGPTPVGRIAAIENPRHNAFHEDRVGFFGFFDVAAGDQAATDALLATARAWCQGRGLSPLRGPVSYSTNDMCGVLVEGFDQPPMLMMPWNRPDVDELLRGAGLVPAKDLLALWIPTEVPVPERFVRVVDRRLARTGTTLRPLDLRDFPAEVARIKDLYNRCWERNWGFVPATDAEFDHAAKDLKQVICPDLSAMAERDGTPLGFSIFLKDLNEALVHLKDGRLWPFGWLTLLRRMKRISARRCVLLGVVPEARGGAINEAFFLHAIRTAKAKGFSGAEASWVLEDNEAMLKPILAVGGRVTKRYRIYESSPS